MNTKHYYIKAKINVWVKNHPNRWFWSGNSFVLGTIGSKCSKHYYIKPEMHGLFWHSKKLLVFKTLKIIKNHLRCWKNAGACKNHWFLKAKQVGSIFNFVSYQQVLRTNGLWNTRLHFVFQLASQWNVWNNSNWGIPNFAMSNPKSRIWIICHGHSCLKSNRINLVCFVWCNNLCGGALN